MARWIALIAIVLLLLGGWVLFEVSNVWPFNAGRIVVLRLMFAAGAAASVVALAFGRSRVLPPAFVAASFVCTTIYSQAVTTFAYLASATAIVALIAALGSVARPPLYVG